MATANENRQQDAPAPDIFDALRAGFAAVNASAKHVRINEARLAAYADTLPSKPPVEVLDTVHHFIGTPEETAAYVLTLDSINFGSGYKPFLEAEGLALQEGSIYYTLSGALKKQFETAGMLTPAMLSALTPDDVGRMFGLNMKGAYSAAFAKACAGALNEMGDFISARHQGRFMNFVDSAQGSVEPLVRRLAQLKNFSDVHPYGGRDIAFYKRAQIAAVDLHLAFRHFGRELFTDTDRLTMFADNAVPHVLKLDGVLEYDEALRAKIAAGALIPPGSVEEVEIRACAAHAVELMAARKGIPATDIDHMLWHASRGPKYRQTPPHRTLTIYY